jgi:peptidoglycan/LPS O-acetylase OafA/YrhL
MGLRGLAVVAVIVGTALGFVPDVSSAPKEQPLWYSECLSFARLAVPALFVLSGFAIHLSRTRRLAEGPDSLKGFYVRRLARLYPLFIVASAIVLLERGTLARAIQGNGATLSVLARAMPFFLSMTQSWVYLVSDHHALLSQLGSRTEQLSWYISTTWFLYLVYPAVARLVSRRSFRTLASVAFTVTAAFLGLLGVVFGNQSHLNALAASRFGQEAVVAVPSERFVYWLVNYSPYFHIYEFLLGVLAAEVFVRRPLPRNTRKRPGGRATLGAAVAVAATGVVLGSSPSQIVPGAVMHYLLFSTAAIAAVPLAGLVLCLARFEDSALARMLALRPAVLCGTLSYAMYLGQYAIMAYFGIVFMGAAPNYWGHIVSIWMRIAIGVAQLIGLALISRTLLERPLARVVTSVLSRPSRTIQLGPAEPTRKSSWLPAVGRLRTSAGGAAAELTDERNRGQGNGSPVGGSAVEGSRRSSAIPSLTGARAAAALSVVIGHALVYVPLTNQNQQPTFFGQQPFWFAEGRALTNFGMALFFVLSGFVIHYNYSRTIRESRWTGLWNFFVARFARLYPLYLAILLFIFVDYGVFTNAADGGHPYDVFMITRSLPFFLTFTASWTYFISHGLPVMFTLLYECTGIMWSVSTEWFFYLVYPLLLFVVIGMRRTSSLLAAVAATAAVAIGVLSIMFWKISAINRLAAAHFGYLAGTYAHTGTGYSFIQWAIYYAPYLRFLEFVLGVLVAAVYVSMRGRAVTRRETRLGALVTYVAAVIVVAEQVLTGWPGPPRGFLHYLNFTSSFGMAIPMALVVFCLARYRDTWLSRALSSRPAVLSGEASYSIYLLQFVVIGSFGNEFRLLDAAHVSTDIAVWFRIAIGLLELVGLSLVSYTVLERPTRRWLRRKLSIERRGPVSEGRGVTTPSIEVSTGAAVS